MAPDCTRPAKELRKDLDGHAYRVCYSHATRLRRFGSLFEERPFHHGKPLPARRVERPVRYPPPEDWQRLRDLDARLMAELERARAEEEARKRALEEEAERERARGVSLVSSGTAEIADSQFATDHLEPPWPQERIDKSIQAALEAFGADFSYVLAIAGACRKRHNRSAAQQNRRASRTDTQRRRRRKAIPA